MARRNTVNFLQIENGLEAALQTCEREAQKPWSQAYKDDLERIAARLESVTAKTDEAYLEWRAEIKARLLAAKELWKRLEKVRDELGEYGVEAKPEGRISYWEPEDIIDAASTFLEQIRHIGDIPETEQWQADLESLLDNLKRAQARENSSLAVYQKVAPERRSAIYRAMHAIDEFENVRKDYLR